MKKLLLSILALGAISASADSNDSYTITKVTSAPTIDGQLTEWSGVPTMSFTVHTDGSAGSTSGTAQAVWDDNAIYFAFSISDMDVKSNYTNQDDKLFNNDDLVEIFLDFDGTGKDYLELGVSAANVNYDLTACPAITCGGWYGSGLNGYDVAGLETTAIVNGTLNNSADTDQGYVIEVKIPFSGLTSAPDANFSTPQVGTIWKGNVYTIDYNTGAAVDQANDYLSWSTLNSFGFHQPSKFASFEFGGVSTSTNSVLSSSSFINTLGNTWSVTASGETSLSVFDLAGKNVFNSTIQNVGDMSLSGLNQGVYIVRLENNGIVETKKIMVK